MSANPAKIAGIDRGVIKEGKAADITIADIDEEYVIDSSTFESMGKNTPFNGFRVNGKVITTIVGGEIAYTI